MLPAWLAVVASLPLFLAAAKAHGREVRLERERAGYFDVDFRAPRPPFVDALWARDRRRFWTLAPLAGALLGGALFLLAADVAVVATGALLWGPTVAFVALGLGALARRGPPARGDAWAEAARRGSVAWWSAVAGLAVVAAAIALVV